MISEKQLFKKAILEALSQKYEQELSECQEDAKCSKKHYIRISEITGIPLARVMGKRRSLKRTLVAILIAAALLLTGCTAYVYRDEIREFIEEFYDTYIKVSYSDGRTENKSYIEEYCSLSYVPDGYQQISEIRNSLYVQYIWNTEHGDTLVFEQMLSDGTHNVFDSDEGKTQLFSYKDIVVYCRVDKDYFHYLCNNGKYTMSLSSSKEISEAELQKILHGIIMEK